MEYRMTEKARSRNIEDQPLANAKMNQVLLFMKGENHGVINPDEISAELGVEDAKATLDSMVKAGFLSKEEEESEPEFGIF